MRKSHFKILLRELVGFQGVRGIKRLHRIQADWHEFFANMDAVFFVAELIHQQKHSLIPFKGNIAVCVDVIFSGSLRQTRQK